MSSEKFDPLANLFNMAQLSGLSGVEKRSKEENPLGIDFDSLDSGKKTRPKTPPKPKDDIPQEELIAIDEEPFGEELDGPPSLEEAPMAEEPVVSKQEEPEEDPEVALRMALAQQALMRAKIKRQREEEAKRAREQKAKEEELRKEQAKSTQMAERLASISTGETKSAMDLFLAAMEEPEKKKTASRSKNASPKKNVARKAKPIKPKTASNTSKTEKRPIMANTLSLGITALIQNHLPSLAEFHVASSMDSFNRPQLKAMWMTKRTQFLQSGKLEYAVAAVSVLDALDTVSEGQLVAAYVETTASDYLIWVDREHNRLVAAFANAGEYFG